MLGLGRAAVVLAVSLLHVGVGQGCGGAGSLIASCWGWAALRWCWQSHCFMLGLGRAAMVLTVSLFHIGASRAQPVHASANKVKAEASRVGQKREA